MIIGRTPLFNRATEPNTYPALFQEKKVRWAGYAVKTVLIVFFTITTVNDIQSRLTHEQDHRNKMISMLHTVTKFAINGDTLPPLANSNKRWKNFSINGNAYYPDGLVIKYMNDVRTPCTFKADTVRRLITFSPDADSADQYVFRYERLQERNGFLFKGTHGKDSLIVETQAKRVTDYPLTRFPVRWVRDL